MLAHCCFMDGPVPVFEHSTNESRRAVLLQWRGMPTEIARHRHERDAEFGFITTGSGDYVTGDRSFTLVPGRLFYIPPGVPHGSPGVSPRLHCWTLGIPQDHLGGAVLPTSASCVTTRLTPERARRLARMFADLVAEPDAAAFELGARFVAASALAALTSSPSEASTPKVHSAVETATRILQSENEAGPQLSLDALAKRSGVSRSRLTELFRDHHGMSVVQFRNHERLRRFLELYAAQPSLGMTAAAFAAGFGSYSQFYRTFCSEVGCTPAAYARDDSADETPPRGA